jgi:hypothetical protein
MVDADMMMGPYELGPLMFCSYDARPIVLHERLDPIWIPVW